MLFKSSASKFLISITENPFISENPYFRKEFQLNYHGVTMYSKRTVTLALTLLLLSSCAFVWLSSIVIEKRGAHFSNCDFITRDNGDVKSRFAGGDGTIENPYQISNVTQLQDINLDLSANYTLVNDIDASETREWNNGKGFSPVADGTEYGLFFDGTPFTGSFDGKGYNITGLYINRSFEDYIGLFGCIGDNGRISDITLIDNKVNGDNNVGGLVGNNWGIVENCSATENISGGGDVGGLVGYNEGRMENCFATGKVSGCNLGGLVALNSASGTIVNCYATGDVSGKGFNGGLVGLNRGTVENCYATGNIAGTGIRGIGGLVGENDGVLQNCYAIGNITGKNDYIGGLVGDNGGTVQNCSASGDVSGEDDYVGGLVGENEGTLQNCYAAGDVSGNQRVGGLAGTNLGIIENCYAIANVNGVKDIGGLVGDPFDYYYSIGRISNSFYCINYTAIKNKHNVMPYGIYKKQFDQWLGNDKTLNIDDYLSNIIDSDYYNISNLLDMKNMLPFASSGDYKFKQTGNIDLSSAPNFYIYGFYMGVYDGAGYSISNLNVSFLNNSGIGLFGYIGEKASIVNVSLINNKVSGEQYIGGLIGKSYGTVENCSATGDVSGEDDYVGGLLGINYGGRLQNCYASGTVTGDDDDVGGLIGNNYGTVQNCYATGIVSGGDCNIGGLVGINHGGRVQNCFAKGNVTGGKNVGGLVGYNDGIVENGYATGKLNGGSDVGGLVGYNDGIVENCFWDMETSNQSNSDGGTGKTTIEMMMKSTFLEAGWDFQKIWYIYESIDYPRLQWERRTNNEADDSDNDSIPGIYDDFPIDPAASFDTDGDGSPDQWNPGMNETKSTTELHLDAFPLDPAASLDSDNDGMPDEWNPGMDQSDSTSDPPLELDPYPDDPDYEIPPEQIRSNRFLVLLGLMTVTFIVVLIVIIIVKKRKPTGSVREDELLDGRK